MPRHSDATKAAIKSAVDIVALVGENLPLRRAGSKYKALCPFHDDHNPSLELNPDRNRTNAGVAESGETFLISSRNTNTLNFQRRCACWPIGRESYWNARRQRVRSPLRQ